MIARSTLFQDSPFHQKDSGHQAVCDQHTYTWKVSLSKLTPERFVKAGYTIVCVRRAFTIGYSIKEMAVIRSFTPHSFHLRRTWLEVAKVLFSYSRFLVHLDLLSAERRRGRRWVVGIIAGSQCFENPLGRFSRSSVGRSVDLQGVIGS